MPRVRDNGQNEACGVDVQSHVLLNKLLRLWLSKVFFQRSSRSLTSFRGHGPPRPLGGQNVELHIYYAFPALYNYYSGASYLNKSRFLVLKAARR